MKCLICNTNEQLLTEEQKTEFRLQGWVGVDFYPEVCLPCFDREKEIR